MKNSVIKYILIVSLLMNFSFLGAAAYTHYKQSRYYRSAPFVGPTGIPSPTGLFGPAVQPGYLFEELSLKPAQVKLFQQKAIVFHQALEGRRQEVDRLRNSLIGLMRADNPDRKAIGATIGQINAAQQDMQKMVVSHMLEFKSMLDEKQQKKFLDLIEGAMGQHREAVCP
jgi:Spy/CpxP family protein refolding chaperone